MHTTVINVVPIKQRFLETAEWNMNKVHRE